MTKKQWSYLIMDKEVVCLGGAVSILWRFEKIFLHDELDSKGRTTLSSSNTLALL